MPLHALSNWNQQGKTAFLFSTDYNMIVLLRRISAEDCSEMVKVDGRGQCDIHNIIHSAWHLISVNSGCFNESASEETGDGGSAHQRTLSLKCRQPALQNCSCIKIDHFVFDFNRVTHIFTSRSDTMVESL